MLVIILIPTYNAFNPFVKITPDDYDTYYSYLAKYRLVNAVTGED